MTTMATRRTPKESAAAGGQPADVLVIFGITGDLAKVMTFRSLYRLERRGLLDCPIVGVAPDLRVPEHPEIFAVGDAAWITDAETGEVLPQLGSVALQAGEHAGENIARVLAGRQTHPFRYHDKGTMATISRGAAVIQLRRGKTIKGKSAALAWGAVHLALLSTGEDRAKAVVDWTWAGFTHERSARITVPT